MDIRFSRYSLTPTKKANRLSSLEPKEGVFLSTTINEKNVYADFFPHIPLGDESVDEFLATFKDQKNEYQKKIRTFLDSDLRFQNFTAKKFYNHQLWSGTGPITAPVVKYKLQNVQDIAFHEALKKGVRVRLDANALFKKETVKEFLHALPPEGISLIDYVEDPLCDLDWSDLPLKRARDFIQGKPFDIYIYKPNCEFRPDHAQTIFSAYLGSTLGNWHAYCEMVESGDLSLTHGIICSGYYQEEKDIFAGDYQNGFTPDLTKIKSLYRELSQRDWKTLCSV